MMNEMICEKSVNGAFTYVQTEAFYRPLVHEDLLWPTAVQSPLTWCQTSCPEKSCSAVGLCLTLEKMKRTRTIRQTNCPVLYVLMNSILAQLEIMDVF